MADKDDKTAEAEEQKKEIAKPAASGLASLAAQLESDGVEYQENLGKDDIAIPFLYMIQQMTPMCNKADAAYDKRYEPGLIYDNATMDVYDDLDLVFCHYSACYLEWMPDRGGFAGRYTVAEGNQIRTAKNDKNEDIIQEGAVAGTPGNILSFTHEHAVLCLLKDGTIMPAILSMTSTQVKHSKKLNLAISKVVNEKGVSMPRFFTVFNAKGKVESNDKNSWFVWSFEPVSSILELGDRAEKVYEAAKGMADSIRSGEANVDYNKSETVDGSDRGSSSSVDDDDAEIPF